ncbi:hypothetical protein [Streptomyces sp. f51]|uniref:hypothetical protein n=1 Tax=Streptomyces sp. f51 TaxID=1827742 RepID=UPI00211D25AF
MTEQEGQKLQHIVRRCSTSLVRFGRAMLLASADARHPDVLAAQRRERARVRSE